MDEKDPLPVGDRDDHASDDRAEAEADAEDDSPDAKRPAAFTSLLKLMREHRHRQISIAPPPIP